MKKNPTHKDVVNEFNSIINAALKDEKSMTKNKMSMINKRNIHEVPRYEQEIVVDLDSEKDVNSIDRGASGGCILSEVTIIKNGKSIKGFFSVVMLKNKAHLEISVNGKRSNDPSTRKRIKMVPWREEA